MSNKHYDVPISLNIVVSVNAEDFEAAQEKLYGLSNEELITLLADQVAFFEMEEEVAH